MPDPTGPTGPTGPSNPKAELDILASAVNEFPQRIARASAQSGDAVKQVIEDIRRELELYLMPAFKKLQGIGLVKQSTLTELTAYFREAEKTVTRYNQIVGSQAEKQAEKLRSTLQGQRTDIEKYYKYLAEVRLESITDAKEAQAINSQLEKEQRAALMTHQANFYKQKVAGGADQSFSMLASLGGIGSISALINMLSSTVTHQVTAGTAMSRATGNIGGVAETQEAGLEAGFRLFGGFAAPGPGGLSPKSMQEAISNLEALSPQMAKASDSMEPLIAGFVQMGKTVPEAMTEIGQTNAEAGTSWRQMADSLELSRKMASKFGTDVLQNFKMIADFGKVVRGTGADTTSATKQAQEWSRRIQDVGTSMGFGNAQIQEFAAKFEGAIAGMSPSRVAGLVGATTGHIPTSLAGLKGMGGVGLFQDVYKMLSRSAGAQGQAFVPEVFAQQMGLGSINVQMAEAIQKAMAPGGGGMEELRKQGIQGDSANLAESRNKLVAMTSTMDLIAKAVTQLAEVLVPDGVRAVQILAEPVRLAQPAIHPVDFVAGLANNRPGRVAAIRAAGIDRDEIGSMGFPSR